MNPLTALVGLGQAAWLDFLSRDIVADGSLRQLIERDGLTGLTSNPAIFEKAIDSGSDYGAAIDRAEAERDRTPGELLECLTIADIQAAADLLRPVYDRLERRDGFVSLEVSPYLAADTQGTIAEARRLWRAVDRENLMIKVPATPQGLPAIRALLGEGINVNITLLFAQGVYREVAAAFLDGAEEYLRRGGDLKRLSSVASFFVSRIDTVVDREIAARRDNSLGALSGKIAIANAKLAYRHYRHLVAGARWQALAATGAHPQRLLWASTGTKNKAYSDVLYVEALIGADTVNTIPPATLDAFRAHGSARATLEENVDEAERALAALAAAGISLDRICEGLVADGVQQFADAADKVLAAVARKRNAHRAAALDRQEAALPGPLAAAVDGALEDWRRAGHVRDLWAGDARLWTGGEEAHWLGWLDSAARERARLDEYRSFAASVRRDGFTHMLLLGMGGSSLGPEVLARSFGPAPGHPALLVLDSTDPAQIRAAAQRIDPARTLFIVSSKSGTTLEPNILKDYFFAAAEKALGPGKAGAHFIAVTDPGSALAATAAKAKFRAVFLGEPGIGGRYSVLSPFGLVPAAGMGLDIARLLDGAARMARACDASAPPAENPGVRLGAILGAGALAGRDKVTILATPGLAAFGAWLEQLLAESTGKNATGVIPVDGEPPGAPAVYGADRLFVALELAGEPEIAGLAALAKAGQPVVRIALADRYELGQEFFRWEFATAVAGAVIGIDPFDQPDVEASKVKTRALTDAFERDGALPKEQPCFAADGIAVYADRRNAAALAGATTLAAALRAHLGRLGAGDYCALLAYLERNESHQAALDKLRLPIRDRKRVATCLGFGPRFLHSTGQAYKGGPNSGVFLQITADPAEELAVPGRKYGFGVVEAAQALGDFAVLNERGRRALHIHLGADPAAGLARLAAALDAALA